MTGRSTAAAPARNLWLVATVMLLAVGCGTGTTAQRELNSVMVGASELLAEVESERVSTIGLELAALGVPLNRWWEERTALRPGVDLGAWARRSTELLAEMRGGVERFEQRLQASDDSAVRATFGSYGPRWRDLIRALEDQRLAVLAGEDEAERAAVAAYERAVAALDRLDAVRVARVVDFYGPDEAARLLAAQGVDPQRFGLPRGGGPVGPTGDGRPSPTR